MRELRDGVNYASKYGTTNEGTHTMDHKAHASIKTFNKALMLLCTINCDKQVFGGFISRNRTLYYWEGQKTRNVYGRCWRRVSSFG